MMTYRRYRACYDFSARDETELSMRAGQTLLVTPKPNGNWPDPEKFMRGINEASGAEGDFPGGAYVEFMEEFDEEFDEQLYDEPPPPPPRRDQSASRLSEMEQSLSQPQPQPRPRTRKPSSPEPTHNWVKISCQLPFPCCACEDIIWGSLNQAYKCSKCLAVCHTHCLDHVISTQQCVPTDDPSLTQHIDYTLTAGMYTEWPENTVITWMTALRLTDYIPKFREVGINKGADLSRINEEFLVERCKIADEAHRQIILECLDELCRGASSTMPSLAVYGEDTDGRGANRLSGIFSLHRSPSIQSIQSLLGGLGKKRGDTQVCGHNFQRHTFSTPHWCDVCGRFLWGLVMQGVKCRVCGMKVHRMCMSEGIYSCGDWQARRKAIVSRPSFGLELSSAFDARSQKAPTVVLKCIEAVDSRGLRSEGIYRVSPTKSVLMSLKVALDENPDEVDILDSRWDHNTFAGALKLYLRELPDPVFPYQLYEHFVAAGREMSVDSVYLRLHPLLEQLPIHHRVTLDTLLDHLVRVVTHEGQNKMSTRNLALLFGPTLLRPPPDDIQKLIENSEVHCRVFEILLNKTTPPTPELPPPRAPRRLRQEQQAPVLPPRPRPVSAIISNTGHDETDTRLKQQFPPALPGDNDDSGGDIYIVAGGPPTPQRGILPTPTGPPKPYIPLEEQGWYWPDVTKEEVAAKLRDTDDGAFLVRDSSRTKGEYTLTVRKAGSNKLIRIIFSNGKYGFSEPTVFNSVIDLVEFYQREPLTKYNPRLDITLSKPVSRFAKVDDDEDGDDAEDTEVSTESLLIKLQDISVLFDQKNDQYLAMEAKYEECKKDVEKAKNQVSAKNLWLDMIKEQLKIPSQSQHAGLSRDDKQLIMENAKMLGARMREASKALQVAGRHFTEVNMQFRTMDKDINTIRPELMRLQWEKEQYTIKLHNMGMTKEEINQRVKENAISESESIYGTLYGTIHDEEPDEDPWAEPTPQKFFKDPNAPPIPSRDVPNRRPLPGVGAPPTPTRRPPQLPTPDDQLPPPKAGPRGVSPNRPPRQPPRPDRPDRQDRPPPPLPTQRSPPAPGQISNSILMENPHLNRETWYCAMDRNSATELLKDKADGTFLCRPAAKQKQPGAQGEVHSHSIDIVYRGTVKHLKVVTLNNRYGFSVPCVSNSLDELILRYKELSLVQHNKELTTTLKYPVYAPPT